MTFNAFLLPNTLKVEFNSMFLERQVEHSQKVNKFFHRNLGVLAPFEDIMAIWGCNAYLLNSKSNCECCKVFRDLLFVSYSLYGSKIDETREFLNKNYLISFFMDFKNSQAGQGRAFRHLWQMKKLGKICSLFGSVQPISLRTMV